MPKKAVLFDLDGTLLNSLPDISRCMNEVLVKHNLPTHAEWDYRYLTGNGALKLAQRAVGPDHQDLVDTVLSEYAAIYAHQCCDKSYLYEGVREMLTALKEAGYTLVVLSNKDNKDVESVLRHYFAEPPFAIMRGRIDGVPLKPDPTAAINIAKELNIDPDDFWYLGDTPTDFSTCKGAGMHFIAFTHGFRSREELAEVGVTRFAANPAEALKIILG